MTAKPTPKRPASRIDAARSGRPVPVVAVVATAAVAVVLVAVGVVIANRSGDGTVAVGSGAWPGIEGEQAIGPVTVEGDALPLLEDPTADPAVGRPAPKLVGQSPSGEPVTIDPAEGPLVIVFLAHWCPHCQAEVPRLVALADEAGEIEGVPLVAVATSSVSNRPNYPPGPWLAREGWPGPVLLDTDPIEALPEAHAAYGLSGFPFLVAIDGDGQVVARRSGQQGEDGLRQFFARAAGR